MTIPEDKAPATNIRKHNRKNHPLGSIFVVVISYTFSSSV